MLCAEFRVLLAGIFIDTFDLLYGSVATRMLAAFEPSKSAHVCRSLEREIL